MHLGSLRARARSVGDAPDELTRGAQLGDGGELLGVGRNSERDVPHGFGRRNAGSLEGAQIGDERGRQRRELIALGRAGLVINGAVDANRADAGRGSPEPLGELRGFHQRRLDGLGQQPPPRQRADRVDAEEHARRCRLGAKRRQCLEQMPCRRQASKTGPQLHRRHLEIDTLERLGEAARARNAKPSCPGASTSSVMPLAPPSSSVKICVLAVAGSASAIVWRISQPRPATWLCVPRVNGAEPGRETSSVFPSAHVDRLDANAVRRLGDQLLLEIGALDRLVDQLQPLLAGRGCEPSGELHVRFAVSGGAGRHEFLYLVQKWRMESGKRATPALLL